MTRELGKCPLWLFLSILLIHAESWESLSLSWYRVCIYCRESPVSLLCMSDLGRSWRTERASTDTGTICTVPLPRRELYCWESSVNHHLTMLPHSLSLDFLLLMQIFVHRTFKVWCITTLKIHQHSLVWLFPWVSHVFNAPALCQYMPYGMNASVRRPSSSACAILVLLCSVSAPIEMAALVM